VSTQCLPVKWLSTQRRSAILADNNKASLASKTSNKRREKRILLKEKKSFKKIMKLKIFESLEILKSVKEL
jgi:hypothetical protein